MKILIFNFEYPPLGGGGGVATKQLAEELAKRHDVMVVTSSHKGLATSENIAGVEIRRVSIYPRHELATATLLSMISFVPMAFFAGLRIIRQHRPDVINAQFAIPSGLPVAWLARLYHLPFVLSFVGGDLYDPTKGISPHRHFTLRMLVRHVAAAATICTAISSDTKKRAKDLHLVKNKIIVTPLGLIPKLEANSLRTPQQLSSPLPAFVSIGRLIHRKGYEQLLDAWQQVTGAQLVIAGQGPLHKRLQGRAHELGISDRVNFLGFVSEIQKQRLLAESFGYVSAARHEGFGIVYLEAMQAGLPIVSTNDGGHNDFLINNKNALLVAPNDTAGLAKSVNWLLKNPEQAKAMGNINRVKVKDFYIQKTTARFEEVLVQAIRSPILAP